MLFSIIIPTYNRAHLMQNTLLSVLNQEFKEYEVIIVDDGSTDNTKEVVNEFFHYHNLPDWHYFYLKNSERGAARNYGIRNARGEWITFLDSDDLIYSNHLLEAKEFIDTHRMAKLFHSAFEVKDMLNESIKKITYPKVSSLNQVLLNGNLLGCFGVFGKLEIFKDVNFCENRELSGTEDWLLWLRLSVRYTFMFNCKVTGCMIEHTGRSVAKLEVDKFKNRIDLLINSLESDQLFVQVRGLMILRKIKAHMYTYGALHFSLAGDKKNSLKLLLNGLKLNFSEAFSRRFLVNLKYLIFGKRF